MAAAEVLHDLYVLYNFDDSVAVYNFWISHIVLYNII